jgi:hypothetical protein
MDKIVRYKEFSLINEDVIWSKWNTLMDTIIEYFVEFEDDGWYWASGSINPNYRRRISLDFWPDFTCHMLNEKYEKEYFKLNGNFYINVTGDIVDGKIEYKSDWRDDINEELSYQVDTFLACVERVHMASGVNIHFSMNNSMGYLIIVLSGKV